MAKTKTTLTPGKASDRQAVTPEQRNHYVEVAAYYIAERRGFEAGNTDNDWAQAELEINRLMAEGRINP